MINEKTDIINQKVDNHLNELKFKQHNIKLVNFRKQLRLLIPNYGK